MQMDNIRETFADIDIYLFDQIQKGRFSTGMRILDAGCGGGRNIKWFMKNGFDVFAIDIDESIVPNIRELAKMLAPGLAADNFQVATLGKIPFPERSFDWVICNTVLHFARDKAEFDQWLDEMWSKLKPGGNFFARLASSIGIKDRLVPTTDGRYVMPDGTERFIVDEQMLKDATERIRGHFIEPIKTTNVENLRCMTTWVISKEARPTGYSNT